MNYSYSELHLQDGIKALLRMETDIGQERNDDGSRNYRFLFLLPEGTPRTVHGNFRKNHMIAEVLLLDYLSEGNQENLGAVFLSSVGWGLRYKIT